MLLLQAYLSTAPLLMLAELPLPAQGQGDEEHVEQLVLGLYVGVLAGAERAAAVQAAVDLVLVRHPSHLQLRVAHTTLELPLDHVALLLLLELCLLHKVIVTTIDHKLITVHVGEED